MRAVLAALAAALALCAVAPAPVQVATGTIETAAAQDYGQGDRPAKTQTTVRDEPSKDSDDKEGGVPIWGGIGLMLIAAVGGSMAARARNRRRLRKYSEE